MSFPYHRLRRLRRTETMRRFTRETRVSADSLMYPLFAVHGRGVRREIDALPGNYHLSIDALVDEARTVRDLGIPAVLVFGIPGKRDERASESYAPDGIVQQAVRAIKRDVPDLVVAADTCLCEYTPHGHCGLVENGYLNNDASLDLVRKVTLSQAEAGADIVAPAAMLDGQVKIMRSALEENGYTSTAIMAYSVKYASALYDPFFREGVTSTLSFGDKRSHQMDFGNGREAMHEIALDVEEGADIIIIKPALYCLDVVYRAKTRFETPLAVFNVSGECAMIASAAAAGKLDKAKVIEEIMSSFMRAGADIIITYFAKDVASRAKYPCP